MCKMKRFDLSGLPVVLFCTTMFASSLSDRILDQHMNADPEEQSSDQRFRRQVFPLLAVQTYLNIECNATVIAVCASNGPGSCPFGFIGKANVSRCGPATVQHFQATGNIAGACCTNDPMGVLSTTSRTTATAPSTVTRYLAYPPYPANPQYPMDSDPRQSYDPSSYSAPAYYQPEGPYMPPYDPPPGSYRAPFTAPFFVPQLSDPPAPVSHTPAPQMPPMNPYTTPPPYTTAPRYTIPAPYATRPPYAAREVNNQQPNLSMRCAWHNSNWRCVVPVASRSRAISLL
ncbi:hypothetical protein RvY_03743 [Ramazzottius varieornatus]|uniref:Uncharacterized protein n=1 Tax=Ramazzottius varieornatus TaxID=947166 RepID=A0A1D1UP62_RAMVA|nr:hypothetical protein RvY_03743 [Ramazzottius varieornatus]